MADFDDLRLAELLCARLCHDLAGPVGAAAAGAELLEDLAGGDEETLALVAVSANGASARLKFFRTAFGPAAAAAMTAQAMRDMAETYLGTLKSAASPGFALEWRPDADAFDGEAARLLLNLILLAKDCLPRGGVIGVAATDAGLGVTAKGEVCALGDEARDVLLDGGEPSGPRAAQAHFTKLLGARRGLPVAVAFISEGLAFTAGTETRDRE